jgi:HTH-type transcriptional regulator/antitoxin HipB
MTIKIVSVAELGALAKHVRRDQSLDQETAGMLSGNGSTFISRFENGKESCEIGRVLSLLRELGMELEVNLPPNLSDHARRKILFRLSGLGNSTPDLASELELKE